MQNENAGRRQRAYTVLSAVALLLVMVGLVSYSPTLYRLFCAATGYGGTVQRAMGNPASDTPGSPITIDFDSNISPDLDWEFRPERRKILTHIGEQTQIYYYARNRSNETLVGRAVYNITPYSAAPYFFKIQCFCFTDEKLKPGEAARMPVVFYVDKQMTEDADAKNIKEITLSYTFFKQAGLTSEEVGGTRDLRSGSNDVASKLRPGASVGFANDAPRQ
jgi:cytochrome c oxidase assembly protein subunit 11